MSNKNDRFNSCNNFVLYYGQGAIEKIVGCKLAILEPLGQKPESITRLQRSGTLVLAYMSMMEVCPYYPEYAVLQEDDFLLVGGQRVTNEVFGGSWVDLTSLTWRKELLKKASLLLLTHGYDGLFMDTLGNIESSILPEIIRTTQLAAAVAMIKELKHRFPEKLLIQNNGLQQVGTYTAPLLDGICWENPALLSKKAWPWCHKILERLKAFRNNHGLKVLLLWEEKHLPLAKLKGVQELLKPYGFMHYRGGNNYLRVKRED